MTKNHILFLILIFTSSHSLAACLRHTLCDKLEDYSYDCGEKKKQNECDQFVNVFAKALEKQSCADTKSEPIIWSCARKSGAMEIDLHYKRLYELKTKKSQLIFASQKFRDSLDGHLAETYRKKSLDAQKTRKK